MPVRHLLPFALPTGRTGPTGRLTVYLSPRLKADGVLADYPEWVDWPATLAGLNLRVRVDGAIVPHRVVSPVPSSAVWAATFTPDAPVDGHRFVDFSHTPLQPMASGRVATSILDTYVRMAAEHPDGPPDGAQLLALAAAAGLLDGAGTGVPDPGSLAEAADYRAPMDDRDTRKPEAPDFDVHASISLLGHHPELLRHLGLAIDLEIGLPASPGRVRVTLGYGGAGGQAREIGLITLTTPDFLAQPNPDPKLREQSRGFLALAAEKAFLTMMDPHLAASRLSQAAAQADQFGEGVLPALDSRALTLIRPDLSTTYRNRTERQTELETELQASLAPGGSPVELFAEDLTIGQRIDVFDLTGAGRWSSLFQRRTKQGYAFPRDKSLSIVPKPDEGWNTTVLVTEQEDVRVLHQNPEQDAILRPTALFRLDDAFYKWDGWSGAVPTPSSVLDSVTGQPVEASDNLPTADQTAQVAVDYGVVPRTLPRLRFGRTYQFRGRCVDLAGNSCDLATANPTGAASPPEPFGRLEPIAAPTAVRRAPRPIPGIGDSPDTLVLLGDYDLADTDVEAVERLFFPGRVGQDLCELHGLPAGGVDPASYADLVTRDALDLADQTETDERTGELMVTGPPQPAIGYLSDPAAVGLRLDLPALGVPVALSLKGVWPERQATRLVVAAGDPSAVVDPDPDTDLTVFVPQAEIVTGSVSYRIDPAFLDHFALWQRLSAVDQAELSERVMGGEHWMFTPARPLTLIHAVRRPLLAPEVDRLAVDRDLGSAGLRLSGTLVASCLSTDRVTIGAAWTDTVDDPALDAPVPRRTAIGLGTVTVPRSTKNEVSIESLEKRLPDTKRHEATLRLEAYSSFAEYFTEEKAVVLADRPVLLDRKGVVASSVEVRLPDGRRADVGTDIRIDERRGAIVRLPGGVIRSGTQVSVRYVSRPISRTSDEAGSPSFSIIFPNTVAPPAPVVSDVVPASARDTTGHHSGQVLRIYLARPWLVSGDGEGLAVDLSATRVGRDPLLAGGADIPELTAAHFPRATAVTDVDGTPLAVHPVTFDATSRRWYADIELADGFGYRPFLQLTLARYQPDSVDGATRSAGVTLDAVRLGLVRATIATRVGKSVEIEVSGLDGLGNSVQVSLQQADPNIADPELRWSSVGDPVGLVATSEGSVTTWSGSIEVPASATRLLVEEFEPGLREQDGTTVLTTVFVETIPLI
ncbi:hypothetical protein MLP_05320 [Microlunatus phosphovorus NM-1]|uniref:Uncharacterized protein n=1 Tax=Microlunatus phosphovorus (strain ATCC 700054 / DSM 10555 / JCM 9379 / NBRC 101784 / NCIMB 13414 / VKM Ac-1990 / NM-1) TaxID=1032480 RepID=F5XK50_MICPN|nr:hypothetical protein [Microlunatus phosphovorus]BAK33546.1 hypothetical protein MLP_05320 [Microlunatus phosphovorus NM-1]